jgi:phage portal protein BeeE
MASWSRWLPWGERKSAVSAPINGSMISPLISLLTPQEVTPYQAWMFYLNVAPFAKVVDLIADETARLVPLVQIDGKPVDRHPVAEFMRAPGFRRTRQQLIKQIAVQYLVTGNAYVHSIGEVNAPPIALDVLKTATVAPTTGHISWPSQYFSCLFVS